MMYLRYITIVAFIIIPSVIGLNPISCQNLNHLINKLNVGEILVCNSYYTTSNKKIIKHEYQALSTVNVKFDDCLKILKSTSSQELCTPRVLNTEEIMTYSDKHWLNYYTFKGCGTIPTHDCVMEVLIIENKENRAAVLIGKSNAEIIENKGLLRIENFEIKCAIRELASGQTEISLFASYNPLFAISKIKLKRTYPNPASLMEGIVFAAKNIQ